MKQMRTISLLAALCAALLLALPSAADTIIDEQGTVWTVVREFNKASEGWDLRLLVNGNDDRGIWVTEDATLDQDPVIALDRATGKPVIYWSRQVGIEFRIFRSNFQRGEFSTPQAITAGGAGFSDRQPFVQIDEFGQTHLVWFRQRADGGGAALYSHGDGIVWTPAEQMSVPFDHVVGTVTIELPVIEHHFLTATYQFFKWSTGTTEMRTVCRGGDTSPWIAYH